MQHWACFAIAIHLSGHPRLAADIIQTWIKAAQESDESARKGSVETTELHLYHASLLAAAGSAAEALAYISGASVAPLILDKTGLLEARAQYALQSGNLSEAADNYRLLLDRNPDQRAFVLFAPTCVCFCSLCLFCSRRSQLLRRTASRVVAARRRVDVVGARRCRRRRRTRRRWRGARRARQDAAAGAAQRRRTRALDVRARSSESIVLALVVVDFCRPPRRSQRRIQRQRCRRVSRCARWQRRRRLLPLPPTPSVKYCSRLLHLIAQLH